MADHVFKGYSTFSNHGTNHGVIPRFYLQMVDMVQFTSDKEGLSERLQNFLEKNISDFTEFYDIYYEIRNIYIDYREGLTNGKYYSFDNNGAFRHNRSKELILKKKIKDFFIQGRLVIYNFGKSHVIDDKEFILDNFLIVSDKNFKKNKLNCLNSSVGEKYEFLLQMIEKSRKEFLTSFNQIRVGFEHQNLQIEDFKVQIINNEVQIIEPSFGHSNLLTEIEICYKRLLGLIENLMVYFFGLQAFENTNGFMTLFKRDEFNYSNFIYKYAILPCMYETGLTKLIG